MSSSHECYRLGLQWRGRNIPGSGVPGLRVSLDDARAWFRGALFPGVNRLHCLDAASAGWASHWLSEMRADYSVEGRGLAYEIVVREDLGVAWHVAVATENCVVSRRGDQFLVTYRPGRPDESQWKARDYIHAAVMIARERVVPEGEVETVFRELFGTRLEEGQWIR